MAELRFEAIENGDQVQIQLFELDPPELSEDFLRNQFNLTEFRNYFLMESSLQKVVADYKDLAANEDTKPMNTGEPIELVVAEKKAAHVSVEISSDKMSCSLMIESAYGVDNPNLNELQQALADNNVVKGVDEARLSALANQLLNVSSGTKVKQVVAKGKSPGQSKQAQIILLTMPLQDRLMKPQLRGDGTVDMHDFGEIDIVEPGDELVRRVPPVVGEPGFDVLGETVYAVKPEDRELKVGEGAQFSPTDKNLMIAARKGIPLKADDGYEVSEAYCVKDVDLKTGNIDFDGTVVVEGSVREGMSVNATKKVLVRDYVESSQITCGGDLVIGKGVLGHKRETGEDAFSVKIEVGGEFHANYVQYADITVAGDMSVTKHIMHSKVQARAITLESPRKSEAKVIGGCVQPHSRLSCGTLGAPSYVPTHVDFSVAIADQLAHIKSVNEELAERVEVVNGMNQALKGFDAKGGGKEAKKQAEKIINTIKHFQGLISELKQNKKQLVEAITSARDSFEVVASNKLYPGVDVQFVQKVIPIKQERPSCKVMAKGDGITFFTLE